METPRWRRRWNLKNEKLHGKGWATHMTVTQTLQTVRQTCSCTIETCPYQLIWFPLSGTFTTTRTIPLNYKWKHQGDGAGETSRTKSCMARAGQHAWLSRWISRPPYKHAHAPQAGDRASLYGFHVVELSHHPVPSQCTTSWNTKVTAPVKPSRTKYPWIKINIYL